MSATGDRCPYPHHLGSGLPKSSCGISERKVPAFLQGFDGRSAVRGVATVLEWP